MSASKIFTWTVLEYLDPKVFYPFHANVLFLHRYRYEKLAWNAFISLYGFIKFIHFFLGAY